MGRKKLNQNVLINDLEIDDNLLLTDDENKPVKQSTNLRSRQGKKKKKSSNKVMKDANLINISDFDTSSTDLSDQMDNSINDNVDLKSNDNNSESLVNYLNDKKEDSETDDFKRNLDLNLKKKKRIFLSNDRTDFLNFILSEQQKLKKSSPFSSLINSSKYYNENSNFRLTNLNSSLTKDTKLNSNHQYSDLDDEDVTSEFNLLLNHNKNRNHQEHSDTAAEFADDEDDGLNYLDYLNHNSTKRKLKRLYFSFFNLFKFRTHVKSNNNLHQYLLSRINQKPQTDLKTKNSIKDQNLIVNNNFVNNSNNDNESLDDLYFESNFVNNSYQTSFLGRLRISFLNLTYYLNFNNKRQNNKNKYFNKLSTAERIELLSETTNDQDLIEDEELDDGWNQVGRNQKQIHVRLVKSQQHVQHESILFIMLQVFIPFLIAGFGTVGAGLVLDLVQHWQVFQIISEIFILVPALLGLKGNLEMTLASRLSTQANLGNLNTLSSQIYMATGNLALIQCQATVVGFLAALFAIAVNWLPNAEFNLQHALLLCASSILTAGFASFILGIIMIIVVVLSHKCNINPDNVATPIAASLGDLTTLALLAHISNFLFFTLENSIWVCWLCILVPLVLIPLWCLIANRNRHTKQVLYSGWTPVVSAMAISSFGGCILDFAVARFKGIAVFQPVINGVGGNLVAVQASRISTFLHQRHKLGELDKKESEISLSPYKTFFANTLHAKTAKVLLLLVVPGHLIFIQGIKLLQAGHTSITLVFLQFYLLAALIQVFVLLYIAQIMIFWMWKKKIDPDNSAIPYLTALGDLIGTGLLSLAFYVLFIISDADEDVGE